MGLACRWSYHFTFLFPGLQSRYALFFNAYNTVNVTSLLRSGYIIWEKMNTSDSHIITFHHIELSFGKRVVDILSVSLMKQVTMPGNVPDKALRLAPS